MERFQIFDGIISDEHNPIRLENSNHFPHSPRSAMVENFTARGFAKLSQGTVHQQASPDFDCYIRKIASRVYSDLALIPDAAFKRGITRMQEARSSFGGGPVIEEIDYFVFKRC
jgi:hypothetical protein